MSTVQCPHCRNVIDVPKNKGLMWGVGCLLAVLVLPVIIAVIGLLAAIAVPAFANARDSAQTAACVNTLQQINSIKEQIAITETLPEGASVSTAAVAEELDTPLQDACPSEGIYMINPVGLSAECSIHGTPDNPL